MSDNPYDSLISSSIGTSTGSSPDAPDVANPYDQVIEDRQKAQQDELWSGARLAVETDPDKYARLRKVANALEIDPSAFGHTVDTTVGKSALMHAESVDAVNRMGLDRFQFQTPTVAAWLANIENMRLAHDDVSSGHFQKMVDATHSGLDQMVQAKLINDAMDAGLDPDLDPRISEMGARMEASQKATEGESFFPRIVEKNLQTAGPMAGTLLFGAGVGAVAGAAAVEVGAGPLAPAAFGVGMALGSGYATAQLEKAGAYQQYVQAMKRKGLPVNLPEAKRAAEVVGFINGAIDVGGFGLALKFMPGLKVIFQEGAPKILLQQSIRKLVAKAIMGYGAELFSQSVQEGVQQVVTNAGENYVTGEPQDVKKLAGDFADTTFQSLEAFALIGAGGAGLSLQQQLSARAAGERNAKHFSDYGRMVVDSKLANRAPDKMGEFADLAVEDGHPSTVYLGTNEFTTLFQDKKIDPLEAAKGLGIEQEFNDAVKQGTDIAIPFNTYLSKVANSQYHPGMIGDLKMGINDMSAKEMAVFDTKLEGLKKMLDEAKAQSDGEVAQGLRAEPVYEYTKKQLIDAGHSESDADWMSMVHAAFVKTTGVRNAVDVMAEYPVVTTGSSAGASDLNQHVFQGSPSKTLEGGSWSDEYIGSGEDTMGQGAGHYFTSSETAAEWYRTNLSSGQEGWIARMSEDMKARYRANPSQFHAGGIESARYWTGIYGVDAAAKLKEEIARLESSGRDPVYKEIHRMVARDIENLKAAIPLVESGAFERVFNRPGNVFVADIPEDSQLANWDRSLNDQKGQILLKLDHAGLVDKVVNAQMELEGADLADTSKYEDVRAEVEDMTFSEFYRHLSEAIRVEIQQSPGPESIRSSETQVKMGNLRASALIKDAGVPGHTYKSGAGNQNFVIYDASKITPVATLYQAPLRSGSQLNRTVHEIRNNIGEDKLVVGAHAEGVPMPSVVDGKILDRNLDVSEHTWSEEQVAGLPQRMFDEAVAETGRGSEVVDSLGTKMAPRDAAFWARALNLPDRARFWYEISAAYFRRVFPDMTDEELTRFIDIVAATSPQANPYVNVARAVGVMSESLQHVPIASEVISASAVAKAIGGVGLEGAKVRSFSGTMLYILGLSTERPMSTNDRQVASSFGIGPDQIGSNPVLYEVLSRFYIKMRDELNSKLPPGAEPYQTWQIQALGWVQERMESEKRGGSIKTETSDDYQQALGRLIDKMERAGVKVERGKLTVEALSDPAVPDAVSNTRRDFLDSPIATLQIHSLVSEVGSLAQTLIDQAKASGDENSLREFDATTSRHLSAMGKRSGGANGTSLVERIASVVAGAKTSISRVVMGVGTYGGSPSANLRLPIGDLRDENVAAFLSVLGKAWNQDSMAASSFREVDDFNSEPWPGWTRTYQIFLEGRSSISNEEISSLVEALGGNDVSVNTKIANGITVDIHPKSEGGESVGLDAAAVHAAASKLFGEHRFEMFSKNYKATVVRKNEYDEKVSEHAAGVREKAIADIVRKSGLDPELIGRYLDTTAPAAARKLAERAASAGAKAGARRSGTLTPSEWERATRVKVQHRFASGSMRGLESEAARVLSNYEAELRGIWVPKAQSRFERNKKASSAIRKLNEKSDEVYALSPSPTPPLSPSWTADRGAMPGEPMMVLNERPDGTWDAALVEVQDKETAEVIGVQAVNPNGVALGPIRKSAEAAGADAEAFVSGAGVTLNQAGFMSDARQRVVAGRPDLDIQWIEAQPEDFIEARNKSTRSMFLSPLEPGDLKDHKLVMSPDGTVGFAVDPQGDVQNVFNNGGPKGAGAAALIQAITDHGGVTLDCFAGYLPDLYTQAGFVETGRMSFNEEFAPEGWQYDVALSKKPDVVFMAWQGFGPSGEGGALERATGPKEKWTVRTESSNRYDDFDAAKQDSRGAVDPRGSGAVLGRAMGRGELGDDLGASSGDWGSVNQVTLNQPAVEKTKTEKFKEWFAGSQIDAELIAPIEDDPGQHRGEPLKVFHGAPSAEHDVFDPKHIGKETGNKGWYSTGFYFHTSPVPADSYAHGWEAGKTKIGAVYPVYLSIKNPFRFRTREEYNAYGPDRNAGQYTRLLKLKGWTRDERRILGNKKKDNEQFVAVTLQPGEILFSNQIDVARLTAVMKKNGHDGVIGPWNGNGDGYEIVAFEDTQIKSAIGNTGSFDKTDPSILNQPSRGSISLMADGRPYHISLGATKDLSTFLHELGHMFIDVTGRIAQKDGASEGTKADYQTALEWMGYKDHQERVDALAEVSALNKKSKLEGLTEEEQSRYDALIEREEKWARGFESFLMEGKPPSPELARPFARFARWLTALYKKNTALKVVLSDDIRQVMKRMVATDEEISKVEQHDQYIPMFDSAKEAGMQEAQFKRYQEIAAEAHLEAYRQVSMKIKAEQERETKSWWKEERAALVGPVTEQIDAKPSVRAAQFLRDGSIPSDIADDNRLLTQDGSPVKLSGEALDTMYGPVARSIKSKLGPGSFVKSGGVHPDEIAPAFGFTSGDAMVRAITEEPSRSKQIAAEIDRKMVADHGDIFKDGTIESVSRQAIHDSTNHLKMLQLELDAMNRAAGMPVVKLSKQVLQGYAEQQIDSATVRQVDPNRYLQSERKAATEATKATRAGKFDEAVEWQKKRMINRYLYSAAIEAKRKADAGFKFLKKQDTNEQRRKLGLMDTIDPVSGQITHSYLQQQDKLLERYELRKVSGTTVAARQSLAAWIQAETAAGRTPVVPQHLLDESQRLNYADMKLGDFLDLVDTVKNIRKQADRKARLRLGAQEIMFDAGVEQGVAQIRENGFDKDPTRLAKEDQTWTRRKIIDPLRSIDAELVRLREVANQLDGDDPNGFFHRILIHPLDDAATRDHEKNIAITKIIMEALMKLSPAQRALLSSRESILIPSIGRTVLFSNLITVGLNSGNESNIFKLLTGWQTERQGNTPWTERTLAEMHGMLKEEHWDLIQEIWNALETLWPELEALERRESGLAPERVDPKPFVIKLPDGTEKKYKGGYFPVIYESLFSGRNLEAPVGVGGTLYAPNQAKAVTPHGHTITRIENYSAPISLSLENVVSHITSVIHDTTHREALGEAWRYMTDTRVRDAMVQHMGEAYYRMVLDRLRAVAQTRNQPSAFNHFLHRMQGAVSASMMGYKLSVTLQNFANFVLAKQAVGTLPMARASIQFAKAPQETLKLVTDLSGVMKHRMDSRDQYIREAYNQKLSLDMNRRKVIQGEVLRMGYRMMSYTNAISEFPAWLAEFQNSQARGLTEEESIRAADDMVISTFGSGDTKDLAGVQTNEVMRNLTMFYGFFSAVYQMTRRAARTAGKQWRSGEKGKAVTGSLEYILWNIVVMNALSEIFSGRPPDDDPEADPAERIKNIAEWAAARGASYTFAMVPFVRDVSRMVESGRRDAQITPLTSLATEFGRTFQAIGKAGIDLMEADDKLDPEVLAELGGNIGSGAIKTWAIYEGMPVSQFNITAGFLWDWLVNENSPENWSTGVHDLLFTKHKEMRH